MRQEQIVSDDDVRQEQALRELEGRTRGRRALVKVDLLRQRCNVSRGFRLAGGGSLNAIAVAPQAAQEPPRGTLRERARRVAMEVADPQRKILLEALDLLHLPAAARLRQFLRRHPEAAGWTHQALAHELGLARETVTRTLKEIRS